MDILFGLLNHIDKGHDDVIFFPDEGGSWQVGADWATVLPVWFKILSATAEPEEYAERITALLSRHYSYERDKMLAIARPTCNDAPTQGPRKSRRGVAHNCRRRETFDASLPRRNREFHAAGVRLSRPRLTVEASPQRPFNWLTRQETYRGHLWLSDFRW
jgi:hypothetical protein